MKKYIIVSLLVILKCHFMFAQIETSIINKKNRIEEDERIVNNLDIDIDYYIGKTEVKGIKNTYVVNNARDSYASFVTVYNKRMAQNLNSLPVLNGNQLRKNQLPIYRTSEKNAINIIESSIPEEKRVHLESCLDKMRVLIYINPENGKVKDVYFEIILNGGKGSLVCISPRELEELENMIINELTFNISEEHKAYSYLMSTFNFCFYHGLDVLS